MKKEEEELLQKLIFFKEQKEYLLRIYEEVDSLVRSGYDGPFMGQEVRGIFNAINDYKKWKTSISFHDIDSMTDNSHKYAKNLAECHAYGLCVSGDPYDFPCTNCPQLKKE